MKPTICDLLGSEYPIIQAGMGGVARAELAAAVSQSGALGCLGMVREPVEYIANEIASVRRLTSRPFGVNLIPAATDPDLLDAQIESLIAEDVPVIFGFWDIDRRMIDRLKSEGRTVVWQVGRLDEATAAARAGVDALIAQGYEAGGHVRGDVPTFALVSRVAESVDVPVIAAGGIADGEAIARALARGASGVACGSIFVTAVESFAHDYHKRRIIGGNGQDTVLTDAFVRNWPDGAKVRVLQSDVLASLQSQLLGNRSEDLPSGVIGSDGDREIIAFSTDSPLRTTRGQFEEMPLYAGRAIEGITQIRPAAEIVADLVEGTVLASARIKAEISPDDYAPSFASPPCMMHELEADLTGFLKREEIIHALNELLAAERAGARVCTRFSVDAEPKHMAAVLRGIAYAESHWVSMLSAQVRRFGGDPTRATGSFYDKALRREGLADRIDILNRGQQWVADRIGELVPRIGDWALRQELEDMRLAHIESVSVCSSCTTSD